MQRSIRIFSFVALLVSAVPLRSQASAGITFTGPYRSTVLSTSDIRLITDGVYRREIYPYVWVVLQLTVHSEALPANGDTWVMGTERKTADGVVQRLGTASLTFDAGSDCFIFGGRQSFCGVLAFAAAAQRTYNFFVFGDNQCIRNVDNQLRPFDYQEFGEFTPAGGTRTSLGIFSYRPTEFPIRAPQVSLSPTSIQPRLPGEIAGQTFVIADVFDDIRRPSGTNCGIRVPNVEVTVKNTITPESGGHKHFSNPDEKGTGEYRLIFGQPLGEPADAQIKGKTDSFGGIVAQYTAGEFGLNELVNVKALDANRGVDVQALAQNLSIRVPGLVPLLSDGSTYVLAGTGGSCDTQHNPSPFDPALRQSHYVTQSLFGRLIELTNRYYIGTADLNGANGAMVSFNDASLPFGGVFDDGSGLKPTSDPAPGGNKCHDSHRVGIDVDVNRGGPLTCPDKLKLNCPLNDPDPTFENGGTREELLTRLVSRDFNGKKVDERPLHYRFFGAP